MNTNLLLLLLIPTIGAVVGAFVPRPMAKGWALVVSLATFIVSVILAVQYFGLAGSKTGAAVLEYGGSSMKIETIGMQFALSMDSISLWLVLLTTLLTPLAILFSFESIKDREKEYYAWMQVLLMAMLGVFVARDLLLFYIFFELTLIPMFFIIGIWGGPEKRFAAAKFFLYTFAGSVFTLAIVIWLGLNASKSGNTLSFDMRDVTRFAQSLPTSTRIWVALGFLAGFAVKVPLFPVHTWLPLAHTEAPTAGSVILAGVLLKLGTYGLIRLALPMGLVGSDGSAALPTLVHVIGVLCVIGIIYGSLVAWVQKDIKKLVAYSSVAHLGFCVLGMMALNDIGMQGSVLYMINHGISTGAMFLVIGMIYDRYHTRDIDALSGLARIMPKMAFFFILFTLASIGLPGTNGFVNEFLTILGAFTSKTLGPWYGTFAALGVILGAVYMLHMAARVIWGPLKVPGHGHGHGEHHDDAETKHESHLPTDLSGREIAVLVPLAIVVFVLGVMPSGVLNSMKTPLEQLRQPVPVAAAADKYHQQQIEVTSRIYPSDGLRPE